MDFESLVNYIHRPLRHHLVFTSFDVEGIAYVNIGFELAKALRFEVGTEKNIAFKTFDMLNEILKASICQHPQVGDYIAIKNLHILFEPELHLSITDILDQWSKAVCLFILDEGYYQEEILAIPDAITL